MKYYKGPETDHFNGTHFFNPWHPHLHSPAAIVRWRMTRQKKPWPKKNSE